MQFLRYTDDAQPGKTGSMLFTDAKVMLCGIQLESFDNTTTGFDYDAFERLIASHLKKLPQIKEYKSHLWKFGHCLHMDKKEFEQLPKWQTAIDLLEKYIFLTDNKNLKINVVDKLFIGTGISFDSPKYIETLTNELKREVEEKKINQFIYIRKGDTKEVIHDIETLAEDAETVVESFPLEQRELVDKKIELLKYWKQKSGEESEKKPVYKAVHMGINALLFLLRIDDFFEKRKMLNSIDEVSVTNQMCRFVADFLIFFQVYNNNNQEEAPYIYSKIRNLYRKPPKEAAPLLHNEVMEVRRTLNTVIKKMQVVKYPPDR